MWLAGLQNHSSSSRRFRLLPAAAPSPYAVPPRAPMRYGAMAAATPAAANAYAATTPLPATPSMLPHTAKLATPAAGDLAQRLNSLASTSLDGVFQWAETSIKERRGGGGE